MPSSIAGPNPIRAAIQRYFQNLQATGTPAAADATAAPQRGSFPASPDVLGLRAQPSHVAVAPQTARGALGALLALGNSVDTKMRSVAQAGPSKGDLLSLALFAAPELSAFTPEARAGSTLADMAIPANGERIARATASATPAATGGITPEQVNAYLQSISETGFAGGKPATAVDLPVAGAGRGGSTATAMKLALRQVNPADFRAQVQAEIARRGGMLSPETEMAATEEVARNIASAGAR